MSSPAKRIAIIGAGVGGLATAARLARAGHSVAVFEKGAGPGGRCGQLRVDGYTFDTGPTLLLMPEVLEETFASVGRKVSDYLQLERCDPNYRIHFRQGGTLTLGPDLVKTSRELEALEKGSFERYLAFLSEGARQYRTSVDSFVGRNFDNLWQFMSLKNLGKVFAVKAHKKMYGHVASFFEDERLRAALTFQTMYLGISPYESPAVYGLLPYTELAAGIWFPQGGLYAIPQALEKVCVEEGVAFHYRTPVRKVLTEGTTTTGVLLADGSRVDADAVVVNADLPWAYRNLLDGEDGKLPRGDKLKYTSSAYMLYWGLDRRIPELLHHNVYLGRDYRGSFDDIFERLRIPEDPSFYVNAPAHSDPSLAPAGKDGLYVLVPVPHQTESIDWRLEGPRLREKVLRRLEAEGVRGVREAIKVERTFTPNDYASELNLERGSAFGLSHNFTQIGYFRPANQHARLRNLFFVGASTQPGTGLPMVMLSARLTTERVLQDFPAAPVGERGVPPQLRATA